MLDLQPIKSRLAAATPGPWECSRERPDDTGDHVICEATFDVRRVASVGKWCNVQLIANAPTDIAALVAEVEWLRADVQRRKEAIAEHQTELYLEPMQNEANHRLWEVLDD